MRKDLKRFNHHYSNTPLLQYSIPHSTIFSDGTHAFVQSCIRGKFLGHLKELFEHFRGREAFTLPSDNALTV